MTPITEPRKGMEWVAAIWREKDNAGLKRLASASTGLHSLVCKWNKRNKDHKDDTGDKGA